MAARLYFAGTPAFAAHCLEALRPHYAIDGVFTQPDRPAGRGRQLRPSAVKSVAEAAGLALFQPEKLNDPGLIAGLPVPDLVVVVAYGLLLPRWFLDWPRRGCINVHASLLPRWRGAAPIQRAIEAGDEETGVGIMQMEAGLDTGPVWLEKRLTIGDDDAGQLHDRLRELGAAALLEALPLILNGQGQPTPQSSEGVCYAAKLSRAEALLDWHRPAEELARKIRALAPSPGATTLINGQSVRLLRARAAEAEALPAGVAPGTVWAHRREGLLIATGAGLLQVLEVQLAGKKPTAAGDLLNGRQNWAGARCS